MLQADKREFIRHFGRYLQDKSEWCLMVDDKPKWIVTVEKVVSEPEVNGVGIDICEERTHEIIDYGDIKST